MREQVPVVILCGGEGLRFAEPSESRSKVMALVGNRPLVWRIMGHYTKYGYYQFILCVKDSDTEISDYFSEYSPANWSVEVVRTGEDTPTAARILRVKHLIETENFFATYGDGLSDVNLTELIKHHNRLSVMATLTAVHPTSQYGLLHLDKDQKVSEFIEKPIMKEWVNGGFFVFSKSIFAKIGENDVLETDVLPRLVIEGQLAAFKHSGFWKSMDTRKELVQLNRLYDEGMLLI